MQSWGTQSQFLIRDTGLEPSKSGVIGLLCAALGKPRQEAPGSAQRWPLLRDLTAMRMAVRVDNPGIVMRDYHTAGGSRRQDRYGVVSADGSAVSTVVSQRFYLADAAFLVGMESENMALLEKLHAALRNPVWPLSLGRKAFPPGLPVCLPDGLRHEGLLEAIGRYPSLVDRADEQTNPLRVVADASPEEASEVRYDVPVDFAARRFTVRHVKLSLLDPRNMEGRPCISQG
jgi:CRISPR system Cascade subunit CasD